MSNRIQLVLLGLVCFLLGCLVTQQVPFLHAQETKAPQWLHGLEFRVRKGGEADFNKDTKRYGVEVFRDLNTNHLVYISDSGSIAVVPAK